jgi:hypothetical protein
VSLEVLVSSLEQQTSNAQRPTLNIQLRRSSESSIGRWALSVERLLHLFQFFSSITRMSAPINAAVSKTPTHWSGQT